MKNELLFSKGCEIPVDFSYHNTFAHNTSLFQKSYSPESQTPTCGQHTRFYELRRTTMPPRKKAWESFASSAVEAEDISPRSCADFRRKWTPTEFCNLSLSERTVILQGLLTCSDSIVFVQVDGGYNFATENTPIHEAMPLLYDFKTNGQIAREACEVFYQVGTVLPGVLHDGALTD